MRRILLVPNTERLIFLQMLQNGRHTAVISIQLDVGPWIACRTAILRFDTYESQIAGDTLKASLTCVRCFSRCNHEVGAVTTQTKLCEWPGQCGETRFGFTTVSQRFQRWHVQLGWI